MVPFLPGIFFAIILFFPGSMSQDSINQLLQARIHFYSDHHPPLMAYIWHYLDLIARGPFLWLCLQTATIWLSTGYIVRYYLNQSGIKQNASFSIAATYTILLFPSVICIIGYVWKDIFMLAMLVASTAIILKLTGKINERGFSRTKLIAFIIVVFSLTIALSTRHNSFAAVFFVIWCACYSYRIEGKVGFLSLKLFGSFFTSLLILFCIFILSGALNKVITDRKSYIQQTVYVYDIGHIAALSNDQSIINKDLYDIGGILESKITLKPFNEYMNIKGNSKYILEIGFNRTMDQEKIKKIRNVWIKSIRKHPYAYLKWRYLVFINMTTNVINRHIALVFSLDERRQKSVKITIDHSKFQVFMKNLLKAIPRAFYNPLYYLIISIVLFILIPIINWNKYVLIWFIIGSGLNYQFSLFFSAGAADYRYSHYMIFCTVSSIILLLTPVLASFFQETLLKSKS